MPQPDGGYVSLNEGSNVYNSTTEPKRANSVLETGKSLVKKAIGHAIGAQDTNSLLNVNEHDIKIQATKKATR